MGFSSSDPSSNLHFSTELEQEDDGRWIAEVPEVPGAVACGTAQHDATVKAYAIALRAVADSVEHSKLNTQS
jgi:predicted RNase H-like HicB family nuclease